MAQSIFESKPCRESVGGVWSFTVQRSPRRIWHPGLVTGPLKPVSPRPRPEVRQHPLALQALARIAPCGGGFVVLGCVIPPIVNSAQVVTCTPARLHACMPVTCMRVYMHALRVPRPRRLRRLGASTAFCDPLGASAPVPA